MRFSALLSATCLALAAPLGVAATFVPVATAQAASAEDARGVIDNVASQALAAVKDSSMPKAQKQQRLKQLFSQNVDIPWVGRFVVGRFWRQSTPDQQQRYIKAYEDFVVTHYANRFADSGGGDYAITGANAVEDGQYVVTMQIQSEGKQISVNYRLHPDASGSLKVIDVVVEGVSMLTTQRSEFASVLNGKGMDYLTDQLQSRSLESTLDKPMTAK